ncbi:LytR/AlgR family response regulator transcription factor [Neobacillus sp. 19]|uniref:LytR/AlgR family response regulator transcription factor n=1 Tax=Neobacillus sp. 19 TaxID=3394458 RepID=UPI003BF7014A
MKKLKVMIADDDLSSKSLLYSYLQFVPNYKVVGEVSNGEELIQRVMKEKPDIVLVDIDMPKLNGVDAAKACKRMFPALQVIFTTGYDEFAVEAFNLAAADYLVKPIEKVRFFIALEKAKLGLQLQKRIEERKIAAKLSIKSNHTFLYIAMEEILFVEKEGRKSRIHTVDDLIETIESLQEIERRLPKYFYRTHRSYVVNLRKIVKIESFGESYLAYFLDSNKTAHVSKLQINTVHRLIGN